MAILLSGLGFTIWYQGGQAFSPGALSANSNPEARSGGYESHAEFESQCAFCHKPLTNTLGEVCIICHTEIQDQVMDGKALHARIEGVMSCAGCHPDHRGRNFNIKTGFLDNFDHSTLDFSLTWHQVDYSLTPMDCLACHVDGDDFTFLITACIDCHKDHDSKFMITHSQDFGEGCLDCHDGRDSVAGFDHSSSNFPLVGSHLEVRCVECHKNGQFAGVAGRCEDCHAEPMEHAGIFSSECSSCHNANAWKPVLMEGKSFDHSVQPGFSLTKHKNNYAGKAITCEDCHGESLKDIDLGRCTGCHAENDREFMRNHLAQFGDNCLECHDGVDRMSVFVHADFFILEGRHTELDCQDCHQGSIYKGTPAKCSDCHAEPEIHESFFGSKCEYCHVTSSWYPAQLLTHPFPLDHGEQGEQECQVCHINTYSEYTCYSCHEHKQPEIMNSHLREGIDSQELPMCILCHADGHISQSIEE